MMGFLWKGNGVCLCGTWLKRWGCSSSIKIEREVRKAELVLHLPGNPPSAFRSHNLTVFVATEGSSGEIPAGVFSEWGGLEA